MTRSTNLRRTALFDLDGTLLPVELGFLYRHYVGTLAESFAAVMSREDFEKALLDATYETISAKDPQIANLDAFAGAFSRRTNLPWDELRPAILRYYAEDYPQLKSHIPADTAAAGVVARCVANGWQLILATQPLAPRSAILERMSWCGIDSFPWLLVTSIENMHSCKPQLEYYREILDMTGLDPGRCVMIGNSMAEDMVAKKVGMKTFLVEDFLVNEGQDMAPDGRGKLTDVPSGINRLMLR